MNTYLIADTKFTLIDSYLPSRGTKGRPYNSTSEMNDALIDNWNSVVQPQDIVYHLGDVVRDESLLEIVNELNGTKMLVQGDKDTLNPTKYLRYFERVEAYYDLGGILLSHYPIHSFLFQKYTGNIHGHLRHCSIKKAYTKAQDKRYLCVSAEQTCYTPISLEEAKVKINN